MPPRLVTLAVVLTLGGCGLRAPVPPFPGDDSRFGRLAGGELPGEDAVCERWTETVARDEWATTHVSFPETDPRASCFTEVVHTGRIARPRPTPPGCSYPDPEAPARLRELAAALERLAKEPAGAHTLLPCTLTPAQRDAALRHNVRVLRALSERTEAHPYAAVLVPGHGRREQNDAAPADFLPGERCRPLARGDLRRLGAMPLRAARAADALRGGVAPVAVASGGAVHSRVVEAFALLHLLECTEGIPRERVLVEPCAEHTHENLRNGARWVHALGGRTAYLVTDDGLQAEYFQESSVFDLMLGSIDQRSLRDWGYVIGSWRQASVGIPAGFWFSPYRFWAERRDELGSLTCVDRP
jgi:hypothetical protein